MTKSEFIAKYAQQAAEMVNSPVFVALLETAREENPFACQTALDATGIIKLAGASNGWHECVKFLKSAHLQVQPKTERAPIPHYQDPEKIENPNRP